MTRERWEQIKKQLIQAEGFEQDIPEKVPGLCKEIEEALFEDRN